MSGSGEKRSSAAYPSGTWTMQAERVSRRRYGASATGLPRSQALTPRRPQPGRRRRSRRCRKPQETALDLLTTRTQSPWPQDRRIHRSQEVPLDLRAASRRDSEPHTDGERRSARRVLASLLQTASGWTPWPQGSESCVRACTIWRFNDSLMRWAFNTKARHR